MRRFFLLSLLATTQTAVLSQKVFFKSAQTFSKADMQDFYASVAVEKDYVFFNAPDYKLYAYKKDGSLAWSAKTGYKTGIPPFPVENHVWVTAYENGAEVVKRFELQTGTASIVPGLSTIFTKPVVRNNILYSTGISEGGCVFAYDLKTDSVIWQRFIAHGSSAVPYYFSDRIVANAEGINWLDIRYNGTLVETGCEESKDIFPSQLKCVRVFNALSHDGIEMNNKNVGKWWPGEGHANLITRYTAKHTFVFWNAQLYVLGNKMKIRSKISFDLLNDKIDESGHPANTIVAADDERVWVLCSGQLLAFNHKKNKLEQSFDLSEWNPYQVRLDGDKLWLISATDGLLYGLSLQ